MKFGETLYQRSVPKWAAYNLNYNELKQLIKSRTSTGAPSPVPIPGQSDHRWSLLEDELYDVLKEQYDNIGLFLRSKHGEIERRLAYLDKSVKSAHRSANSFTARPSLQARKYQRLGQESETIGEDVQALSRFAGTQRTAFRKILKKYYKWTNSDALRARLETEVFSDGQLDVNFTEQMQHLARQTSIIKELEASLIHPDAFGQKGQKLSKATHGSPVGQITKSIDAGALNFDAAVSSIPFGEASGLATYWIHPDNLDEAKVLLLRYMRDLDFPEPLSRQSSSDSVASAKSVTTDTLNFHAAYCDNGHRFVQDPSSHAPSKIALCARWSQAKEAVVTMSDMSPRSDGNSTVSLKRKELGLALDRNAQVSKEKSASTVTIRAIKDFLSLHRDVKPIAEVQTIRMRYAGITNSSEVGTFALLDSNISFSQFDLSNITKRLFTPSQNSTFPHSVLQVRWEFGRKPEVVRAFDTTHLAEKVLDFTLEAAAICNQAPELGKPSWTDLVGKDIRKVPVQTRRTRTLDTPTGLVSGPSSTGESVFSAPFEHSTAGSETSPMVSTHALPITQLDGMPSKSKKRARILAESPNRQKKVRYYSEYDDPDSELNQQGAYTIYVDPDEEFPGMKTMRRIGTSLVSGVRRIWPQKQSKYSTNANEHTPLIRGGTDDTQGEESSESESDQTSTPKYKGLQGRMRPAERYRLRLSRRQRAFETRLIQFYSGILALSYIFLLMSAILVTTGRRKQALEVDVGATVGVVMAFVCMCLSIVLVYLRKEKLTVVERSSLVLADALVVGFGAGVVVGIVRRAAHAP